MAHSNLNTDRQAPWLILLSGTTSSGKTTLADAMIQQLSTRQRPFLHIEADRLLPHLSNIWPRDDAQIASVMSRALHRAVAAFAEEGFDLVVDGILPDGRPESMEDVFSVFGQYRLCYVGGHCDLDVLEQRERGREDREPGWAREQYDRIHRDVKYDIDVNTTMTNAEDNARIVALYISDRDSYLQDSLK